MAPVRHPDQVPHMSAGAGAAGHGAGDADHRDPALKDALVAKELEGLGIALADHPGGRVVIKDIHQLPGVPVVGGAVDRGIVIVHRTANIVLVGLQLQHVGFAQVAFHHSPGVGRRPDRPGAEGFVKARGPRLSALRVIRGHFELNAHGSGSVIGEIDAAVPDDVGGGDPAVSRRLVKPVQIVGQIIQQRPDHKREIDVQLAGVGIDPVFIDVPHRNSEIGVAQLSRGHLPDLCLQGRVHPRLPACQPGSAEGSPGLRGRQLPSCHQLGNEACRGLLIRDGRGQGARFCMDLLCPTRIIAQLLGRGIACFCGRFRHRLRDFSSRIRGRLAGRGYGSHRQAKAQYQ